MKPADLAFGLAVSVVGAAALYLALGMRFFAAGVPGPGFFPVLCASGLTVLGLVLAWQSAQAPAPEVRVVGRVEAAEARRRKLSTNEDDEPDATRSLAVWAGYLAMVPLLYYLGFTLTMMALLTYLLFVIERRRNIKSVAAIVLIPTIIYLLFVNVLGIDLPEGMIGLGVLGI
jgi:hypothetical protein